MTVSSGLPGLPELSVSSGSVDPDPELLTVQQFTVLTGIVSFAYC